jgi:carboxyl-terminal processing protease
MPMKSARKTAALLLLVLLSSVSLAEAETVRSGNPVFDRAVALVEENFYAPTQLDRFRDAVAVTVGNLPDLANASPAVADDAIDFVLASLQASHTGHFVPDQLAYYELTDVFRYGLRDRLEALFPPHGEVAYAGIGIATVDIGGHTFVTDIYDGGPADKAGLLPGDEILSVDGQPFTEIGSFRDKAGRTASLSIRRQAGAEPIAITAAVEMLSPGDTFVSATADSAEIIEHNGYRIGYLRIWSYTEREVKDTIEKALTGPLAGADALVLDLRSRWGGAPADAADTFVGGSPDMTMVSNDGDTSLIHARWRKPMIAIIDEGTRSGMEILAYALKANGVRLIGTRTAANVLAGRGFLLPDDSLLELAVDDVFVDGKRLEGVGVEPDLVVPFDVRYAAGADPQLAAALDEITGQLAAGLLPPSTP